jgi:hypothetical protein
MTNPRRSARFSNDLGQIFAKDAIRARSSQIALYQNSIQIGFPFFRECFFYFGNDYREADCIKEVIPVSKKKPQEEKNKIQPQITSFF